MHYYNDEDLGRFGDIAKHKPELFEKFIAWYQPVRMKEPYQNAKKP